MARKQTSTDIQFRRTKSNVQEAVSQQLNFGEPYFIDNAEIASGQLTSPCNAYLYIGRKASNNANESQDVVTAASSPVFKAFTKEKADSIVFHNSDGAIIDESGSELSVTKIKSSSIPATASASDKFYILCQASNDDNLNTFNLGEAGIYITGNGVMHGAAWNDYAENRKLTGGADAGCVVCDAGDGTVSLSREHLQACPHIVSDTYGYLLDADLENSAPLATSGRALVKVNQEVNIGDCLCAGADGFAEVMTRPEIINFPDRILGIVCEIPSYNDWRGINVNGRVWVNIK